MTREPLMPPRDQNRVAASGRRSRRLGLESSQQSLDRRRQLGALTGPVMDAIDSDAQRIFSAGGNRIVEADSFDEAPVAAIALVGGDDVEKRALFGASAGKADYDHDESLGQIAENPKV
jgi:hypothetical protein